MSNAELIARLEKSESGSRLLDEAMFDAVRETDEPQIIFDYPAYTTSLDAIVALIEEKVGGGYRIDASDGPQGRADAWVWRKGTSMGGFWGDAWSPPLALCIALLRALDQNGGDHG